MSFKSLTLFFTFGINFLLVRTTKDFDDYRFCGPIERLTEFYYSGGCETSEIPFKREECICGFDLCNGDDFGHPMVSFQFSVSRNQQKLSETNKRIDQKPPEF